MGWATHLLGKRALPRVGWKVSPVGTGSPQIGLLLMCFRSGSSYPHGRTGCGVSHTLGLNSCWQPHVPGDSCTSLKGLMEGSPTKQRAPRTEGLAQTCRPILHSRTSHRVLKSMTEELGIPSSPQVGVPVTAPPETLSDPQER